MVSRRRVVHLDVAGRFAFVLRGTLLLARLLRLVFLRVPRVPRRLPALRRSLQRRLRHLAAIEYWLAGRIRHHHLILSWNNPGSRARGEPVNRRRRAVRIKSDRRRGIFDLNIAGRFAHGRGLSRCFGMTPAAGSTSAAARGAPTMAAATAAAPDQCCEMLSRPGIIPPML